MGCGALLWYFVILLVYELHDENKYRDDADWTGDGRQERFISFWFLVSADWSCKVHMAEGEHALSLW